jgi:hypothetical protein
MVDDFDLTQHPKTVFVTGKEQVGSVLIYPFGKSVN